MVLILRFHHYYNLTGIEIKPTIIYSCRPRYWYKNHLEQTYAPFANNTDAIAMALEPEISGTFGVNVGSLQAAKQCRHGPVLV